MNFPSSSLKIVVYPSAAEMTTSARCFAAILETDAHGAPIFDQDFLHPGLVLHLPAELLIAFLQGQRQRQRPAQRVGRLLAVQEPHLR